MLKQLKLSNNEADVDNKSVPAHAEIHEPSSDKPNDKKKLTSGHSTKPDESGIKKQVKFAHEKLDPKHCPDRVFDNLTFPTLIAGELELASQKDISEEERSVRTSIAKILCYHKLYLSDEDLKAGYDSVLKSVEQGSEQWSDRLAMNLNAFCEFRANVAWREKSAVCGPNSTGQNKSKSDNKTSPDPSKTTESNPDEPEGKVIYCMDFNKGMCPHDKSHPGKWKGKKVTKWYICKVCLRNSELNSHAERDCKNKK